jgi:hypothetical protein
MPPDVGNKSANLLIIKGAKAVSIIKSCIICELMKVITKTSQLLEERGRALTY